MLAHIWPTHHENVHFYGTHSVDVDGEPAKLDSDGYRPLRAVTATEAPVSVNKPKDPTINRRGSQEGIV